uniref:Uncharacterized protein n=1 Tax=Chromera velia CCMP2878 TaxID=1169474 RepID=A0A0G4I0U7_9ALVE|eukprot:Cvel_9994.t1-p1 / transcript=Cvel_9994.t1 / gene=Cvel_9994 / organism=Chromera_velia_CCMP2878 / gene_product=hypothetical protein / transcript_product=hypothetical protein / location=Cvel_scaffold591:58220-59944(+) / protein_length=249 / sequence_SO=supercontig / SO=protein_coding / is_pseudo=false
MSKSQKRSFHRRVKAFSSSALREAAEILHVASREGTMGRHLQKTREVLGPPWGKEKRPAKIRALTSKDVEVEEGEEGDAHWEGLLRAALGTLQWAIRLNPLHTVWASVAAKSVSKPSRKVFKGVVRLIDMLKARKEGQRFSSVGDTRHIHCFTDCGRYAATYTGRMGWLVHILPGPQGVKVEEDLFENWVLWHTARTTKKISSGTAGELMAVELCVKKVERLIALVGKLWNCQPPIFIHIDCGPVYDQM